jgi:hypothetical protein
MTSMRNRLFIFFNELRRHPSAIAGLTIVLLLVIGSVYAVTAYPYEEIGRLWNTERLTGRAHVPRLAQPAWTNFFRKDDFPSVILLESSDPAVTTRTEQISRMAGAMSASPTHSTTPITIFQASSYFTSTLSSLKSVPSFP